MVYHIKYVTVSYRICPWCW